MDKINFINSNNKQDNKINNKVHFLKTNETQPDSVSFSSKKEPKKSILENIVSSIINKLEPVSKNPETTPSPTDTTPSQAPTDITSGENPTINNPDESESTEETSVIEEPENETVEAEAAEPEDIETTTVTEQTEEDIESEEVKPKPITTIEDVKEVSKQLSNADFHSMDIEADACSFENFEQVNNAITLKQNGYNDTDAIQGAAELDTEKIKDCIEYKNQGYDSRYAIRIAKLSEEQLKRFNQYQNDYNDTTFSLYMANEKEEDANKGIRLYNAGFKYYDIPINHLKEMNDKNIDTMINLTTIGCQPGSLQTNYDLDFTPEQLGNAEKLHNAKCNDYHSVKYAQTLDNSEIDRALKLLSRDIDVRFLDRFVKKDSAPFYKIDYLTQQGVTNVVDLKNLTELSDDEYKQAEYLISCGIKPQFAGDKAKFSPDGCDIKQSLYDSLNYDKIGEKNSFELLDSISNSLKSKNITDKELCKILDDFKYKKEDLMLYNLTYNKFVCFNQVSIQNDLINNIQKLIISNPKQENENISQYFENIKNKYIENNIQENKEKDNIIKSNLKYSENPDELEKIELTPQEVEELRNLVKTWDKKGKIYSLNQLAWEVKKKYISGGCHLPSTNIEKYCLQQFDRYETDLNKPMARWMYFDDKNLQKFLQTIPEIGEIYTMDRPQSFSKFEKGAETQFHDNNPNQHVKIIVYPKNTKTNAFDLGEGKYGYSEVIYPSNSKFKVLYKGYEERIHDPKLDVPRMEGNIKKGSHKQMTIYLQEY